MNDVTTSDIRGMITESHIHAAAKGLYSCIRRTPTFRLCRGEKKCALYTRIYGNGSSQKKFLAPDRISIQLA